MRFGPKILILACVLAFACTGDVRASDNVAPERVHEIAGMLSPLPAAFGQPITNRAAWLKIASEPALESVVASAEKLASQPIPEMTDDVYLDCLRTGNRDRGQSLIFARSTRLTTLALAECVEDRGRFLQPLQKIIESICAERAWTYPAHDLKLETFHGKGMRPDLRATSLAFELATADYVLGDKLPDATRQLLRDNVRKRVLLPFRNTVEGKSKETYWLRVTNNWNAVCLAGTIGAALAIEPSPEDRAWYIAAGEKCIQTFLSSFGKDGYCYEGIGYWNYGFGHFIMLTEEMRQATGGKVDLFKLPEVELPAEFGFRSEIVDSLYPTISDVSPGTKPDPQMLRYVNERYHLASKPGIKYKDSITKGNLAQAMFALFAEKPWPIARDVGTLKVSPLRTWFDEGGVLIARPNTAAAKPFAVVLKGGSNGETHNHNDVGSFSVVLGRTMLICDPGGEVYTRRTFGPQRYDSGVLNSFGHAVPVIAGKLQETGSSARAEVVRTQFSDDQDLLVFNLRSTYAVPELKKLERSFVYRRGSDAGLRVSDDVVFEKPETFESALITWGDWREISSNEYEISDGGEKLRVKVDTGGVPFTVRKTLIDEHVHTPKQPWHIGIVLEHPMTKASVQLDITPESQKK